MKRVCCFGAYEPADPRHRILRDGRVRAGHEVVEARVPARRAGMAAAGRERALEMATPESAGESLARVIEERA